MESYTSQEALIVAKALERDIDTAELNAVFERTLEQVTAEHGGRSAAWRLARSEFLVWCHFFPGEPFPSIKSKVASIAASTAVKKEDAVQVKRDSDDPPSPFPKALQGKSQSAYEEAARRQWVHDRYQPESPKHDSYRPKEKDSYRPVQEIDSYRPLLEENKPPIRSGSDKPGTALSTRGMERAENKDRGASRTLPNGNTARVSTPSASDDTKPYRSQKDLIDQKAVAAGISREEIEACLEEKAGIVEKRFAERSRDWQMFFVEASTWGRFFKGQPFPGIEPSNSKHPEQIDDTEPAKGSSPTKISTVATNRPSLQEYSGSVSEKLMEDKATSRGERREFFQYLQRMRTYSRLQHPSEACNHIRGWFADNLTWQNFFGPEPYPFAQPPGGLSAGCAACSMLPRFARLTGGKMRKVMDIITAHGPTGQLQLARKSSPVVGAPTAPAASRNAIVSTTKPQAMDELGKREPLQSTKTVLAHSPIPKSDSSDAKPGPGPGPGPTTRPITQQASSTLHSPSVSISRRDLRTPPPGLLARPASDIDFHPQSVAPAHLSAKLAQMWAQDPFLGKGTVVMQNTVPSIYNKTFVGELFNCFVSDTKQAIAGIGAELKCHIQYYVISTGDLFLWTEPQIPGDVASFNRGHVFITGWVARVSSFGMVKPSVHWNAIRTPLAPLQAQPSMIVQPRNTTDAFNPLANYVNAAVADKPKPVVTDKSASTEKGPSTDVAAATTNAQKPATLPLARKAQPEPSKAAAPASSTTTIYPSIFEEPEKQWHRYRAAFRTSDIDRLLIEEAAKNEGDLRMVLDKESGQIVSVEELVKRTAYRCSLNEAKVAGSGGADLNVRNGVDTSEMRKRKADDREGDGDGEDGREEKRACV